MSRFIAFDFDGVIVDSIYSLKSVYFDFLSQFDIQGTEIEFASLNGPSLTEIVARLKAVHSLDDSLEILLQNYRELLTKAYLAVPLVSGVKNVLQELREKNINMALVTSSIRSEVEEILAKYDLAKFFQVIITGDDVTRAKPSPDLYLKLKEKFNKHEIWAVEDSTNGIKAAKGAGVNVIYFDQFNEGNVSVADCRITSMTELSIKLEEIEKSFCIVEETNKINIKINKEKFLPITEGQNEYINKLWNNKIIKEDVHDSDLLYYINHEVVNGNVVINAFWSSYRYFYCANHFPSLGLNFVPIAISGVCVTKKGRFLIGKRSNVTEYGFKEEFAPSGGISSSAKIGDTVDIQKQLIEELIEETSIIPSHVVNIQQIGIVKDLRHNVLDLCFKVDISNDCPSKMNASGEYSFLEWRKFREIDESRLIPTSLGILKLVCN